jgi:cytochrome c oxidase subunit 4
MASAVAHAHGDHAHPSQPVYVRIAIILGLITGVEVLIYYIPALDGILVPALLVLSAIKFVTVVGYFMHLKFDTPLLAFIFGAAMIVSIIMFIALWVIMHFDMPSVFNANMSLLPDKPSRP